METPTAPIQDSVAKVGNEIAVGEDLEFQRRWWRFEKLTWSFFGLLVLLDLSGAFGRGPLANAYRQTADGAMNVKYERVERFSTPSILTIHFGANAVRDGAIKLWVSDPVLKELGNQRISPQPSSSITTDAGILYTFPAGPRPNSVEFALQPAGPGLTHFTLRLVSYGSVEQPQDAITAAVFVMP